MPAPEREMSVTAAKGFVASGVHCGIRKKERRDLAIVRSLVPATGAGKGPVAALSPDGTLVALVAEQNGRARPLAVFVP